MSTFLECKENNCPYVHYSVRHHSHRDGNIIEWTSNGIIICNNSLEHSQKKKCKKCNRVVRLTIGNFCISCNRDEKK